VAKASDWLREERRKVLGQWAAFCVDCGAAFRWFEETPETLPASCPQCGGSLCRSCSACGAPFSSAFAVDCEECGAALRPPELHGLRIRKQPAG
jgi:DNA-directed RNA polymerase subunit RPC12/RpoP